MLCVYWKNLLTQVPVENPINSGLMITLIAHSAHHQYVIPKSPTNMSSKHYEENFLFVWDCQLFASYDGHFKFLLNVFVFLIRMHISFNNQYMSLQHLAVMQRWCYALFFEGEGKRDVELWPIVGEKQPLHPCRLLLSMTQTDLNEIIVHKAWHTQAPQAKLEHTDQISSRHVKPTESFCKYCRQNMQ